MFAEIDPVTGWNVLQILIWVGGVALLWKRLQPNPTLDARLDVQEAKDKQHDEAIAKIERTVDRNQTTIIRKLDEIQKDNRIESRRDLKEIHDRITENGQRIAEHTARISTLERKCSQ